ncbi:transposase, partial [Microcoleus vaginatus]|uniref:transposase n=1 Tax=Microcoleus vaginatus TaxID=119532 RepID=UPI0032AE7D79
LIRLDLHSGHLRDSNLLFIVFRQLCSRSLYHTSIQQRLTLACIFEVQANGKIKNALLFSTDIHLPPEQILEYYQARFQIEFIFGDAKQFTGSSDCQARHLPRLDFHFNASLIALNLAKHQLSSCH